MKIDQLEKNVEGARKLISARRTLRDFVESAPKASRFWVGVPSTGEVYHIHGAEVYIEDGHADILARAQEIAKAQISDIERQLTALGVSDWQSR